VEANHYLLAPSSIEVIRTISSRKELNRSTFSTLWQNTCILPRYSIDLIVLGGYHIRQQWSSNYEL